MNQSPSPLFITKMQKQPGSPTGKGLTPPRSPSGDKYGLGRTVSPKNSLSLIEEFKGVLGPDLRQNEKKSFGSARNEDPYNS